ncbi:MAG: DUF2520 domain-containing protein [Bdellovibrionales bacterium]|nr:DUF2520 domain-containing protein [Bdellovibrionales bacterium]
MKPYLIVGDGRLAKHFAHYFSILNIPHLSWSRKSTKPLTDLLPHCERVLLLISDKAIAPFVESHPALLEKKLIHCSGLMTFPFAESAHPLNTFGSELYSRECYLNTPFILESGRALFADILPGLHNPHYYMPAEKKPLYHSLCVMAGNFTTLLWQNTFEAFENELHLPKEALLPFLEKIAFNLENSPREALTGPISRGDTQTLIRNLDALHNRAEQALYYAFLNFVLAKKKQIGELQYERLGL